MNMPISSIYTVLVTGANAGLGYATCCRLIDEFLSTRPQSQSLNLIITTRDATKNASTLQRLQAHIKRTISSAYGGHGSFTGTSDAITKMQIARIRLQGESLDLLSLVSVKRLARRLTESRVHIDALILNAGIGGWSGLDWSAAIWTVCTDLINATTWPTYKKGYTGRLAKQIDDDGKDLLSSTDNENVSIDSKDVLGETFTANVFGHYMLAHWLMPCLASYHQASTPVSATHVEKNAGRIIWISSVEAQADSLDLSDLQGLSSSASYESSKRLTDLLVLTSELPATRKLVDAYTALTGDVGTTSDEQVRMYVCHPGICATSIAGLHVALNYAMICAFYVARLLGSPWHTIDAYIGAVAGVWLALTQRSVIGFLEGTDGRGTPEEGKSKWGSSTNQLGHERVLRTDVAGWGWSGIVGDGIDGGMKINKGKHRNSRALTAHGRQEFEATGVKCWEELESLRLRWEKVLERV